MESFTELILYDDMLMSMCKQGYAMTRLDKLLGIRDTIETILWASL